FTYSPKLDPQEAHRRTKLRTRHNMNQLERLLGKFHFIYIDQVVNQQVGDRSVLKLEDVCIWIFKTRQQLNRVLLRTFSCHGGEELNQDLHVSRCICKAIRS